MGGVLSKIGGVFNPTISGTGQTARSLSDIGYSGADLSSLDPKRALLKGAITGGLDRFQNGSPSAQAGPVAIVQAPAMSQVDPGYFRPTDFSANMQKNPIYG